MMVTLHFLAAIQIHGEINRCNLLISCTMRHHYNQIDLFPSLGGMPHRRVRSDAFDDLPRCSKLHDLSKVAELELFHGAKLSQMSTLSPTATTGWMPDPAEKTNMM